VLSTLYSLQEILHLFSFYILCAINIIQLCTTMVNPLSVLDKFCCVYEYAQRSYSALAVEWYVPNFVDLLVKYIHNFFFIILATRCTNFPNLLRHENLHVSDSSSAHHQEFIRCTLGTGIRHTGFKTAFEHKSCLKTCMTCISAECTVNKLLMMGRGTVQNMQIFMLE